jgi:transcriptional regulator with PAS, ATPase and Fis domain
MRFDQLPVPDGLKDFENSSVTLAVNGRKIRMERKPLVHQDDRIGTLVFVDTICSEDGEKPAGASLSTPVKASRPPVGKSSAFRKAMDRADKAARCDSNVLVLGDTGTGKEVMARYIHEKSARRNKPFVAINCGSIPRELLGSELFGYDAGAFTGAAQKGRPSKFEMANGGTILLDEISEMSIDSQVYLLRIIEERTVYRLGGCRPNPVDIRIVAASNKDLHREVEAGRFRADLLFRINVLKIDLPTLKERKEDIPLFVNYFIRSFSDTFSRGPIVIEPSASSALMAYDWPGNIRELRNAIEHAVMMSGGDTIHLEDLPEQIRKVTSSSVDVRDKNRERYRDFLNVYKECHGNISRVSKALGISRPTVYAWLTKLRLPSIGDIN